MSFCYMSYTKITSRKLLYMFSYFNSGSRFKNFLKNGRYLTTFANTLLVDCTVLPRSLSAVSDSPGWRTGNRIKISHSTRADSFSYYAGHHNGIALLDILPLVIPPSRLPLSPLSSGTVRSFMSGCC